MTSTQSEQEIEVRYIESDAPPERFARGWHCLGLADSFRDGQPHSIHIFNTKLVVFADSAGDLQVIDAYCRHMGGDLSQGTIEGDSVACPFHNWRWNGKGKCAAIPYARRVPPLARTRGWTTLERNGQLFIWNDPQGNQPPAEVTIPEIQGFGDGGWSPWTWDSVVIENSHCREIVDNLVDMAHFFYVHFAYPVYFKNVFEGHIAAQYSGSQLRADSDAYPSEGEPPNPTASEAVYYGPSYMIDYESVDGLQLALVNCHIPITSNSFKLQWGLSVKYPEGANAEAILEKAKAFSQHVATGFRQDVEIWKNKTKIDNPLLCDEDGPIYQLRRWYQQFYVDIEDVTPDMVARFEHELDVKRANDVWAKEVEANIDAGITIGYAPSTNA